MGLVRLLVIFMGNSMVVVVPVILGAVYFLLLSS